MVLAGIGQAAGNQFLSAQGRSQQIEGFLERIS
jgi:hypothetical protein